jgi:hypothetical protein
MTGLERNSDIVVMASYAPLFVNVNPGGMQWPSNLIGYDALSSYGSPSYYAQVMFSTHLGDQIPDSKSVTKKLSPVRLRDLQFENSWSNHQVSQCLVYVAAGSNQFKRSSPGSQYCNRDNSKEPLLKFPIRIQIG